MLVTFIICCFLLSGSPCNQRERRAIIRRTDWENTNWQASSMTDPSTRVWRVLGERNISSICEVRARVCGWLDQLLASSMGGWRTGEWPKMKFYWMAWAGKSSMNKLAVSHSKMYVRTLSFTQKMGFLKVESNENRKLLWKYEYSDYSSLLIMYALEYTHKVKILVSFLNHQIETFMQSSSSKLEEDLTVVSFCFHKTFNVKTFCVALFLFGDEKSLILWRTSQWVELKHWLLKL